VGCAMGSAMGGAMGGAVGDALGGCSMGARMPEHEWLSAVTAKGRPEAALVVVAWAAPVVVAVWRCPVAEVQHPLNGGPAPSGRSPEVEARRQVPGSNAQRQMLEGGGSTRSVVIGHHPLKSDMRMVWTWSTR